MPANPPLHISQLGQAYPPAIVERLLKHGADPKQAAIRYGQKTGRCSCCGRELTKHTSIPLP